MITEEYTSFMFVGWFFSYRKVVDWWKFAKFIFDLRNAGDEHSLLGRKFLNFFVHEEVKMSRQ